MSPSRRRRRASPAWEGRPTIKVATLPGRGLYARHLGHPEGVDAVYRPTVGLPGSAPRRALFDRGWLAENLDQVDIVHVHGVRPGQPTADVVAAADAVRASGTPLVVTGYHLSDPSGADDAAYADQLDALVPRADAVVTLTETAAEEMRHRLGRRAARAAAPARGRLRPDAPAPAGQAQRAAGRHPSRGSRPADRPRPARGRADARRARHGRRPAEVHVHETVLDSGSASYDLRTVREIDRMVTAARGALRVHRPFSESQLWDHLFGLDVSVVPGLFGSHSVWPEACADLGTQPLLPAGTHASTQQPCLTYEDDGSVDDLADSFAKALWTAREQGCVWRADPEARWAERVRVAEALRGLYERLLGLDRR